MHDYSHTITAGITGATLVSVPMPIGDLFNSYAMACGILFCVKAGLGAAISIGLNKLYDYCKNRKATTSTTTKK